MDNLNRKIENRTFKTIYDPLSLSLDKRIGGYVRPTERKIAKPISNIIYYEIWEPIKDTIEL